MYGECVCKSYDWGTNYVYTGNGHGQSGWSAVKVSMCENRVSVSKWSPFGCECFRTKLTSQVHSLLL